MSPQPTGYFHLLRGAILIVKRRVHIRGGAALLAIGSPPD
jgi:hypothetical protein